MAEIFNFERLIFRCPDEASSINFLRTRGILHQERQCCGLPMRLSYATNHGNRVEVWRCVVKACKATKGLRPDTWIHPSTLPFTKIVRFIYAWSYEMTSRAFCERELEFGVEAHTTTDWNNYMREVCASWILQHQGMIGGPGQTVEVDESVFTRRKTHVGRVFPQQWVFGGFLKKYRKI
jgi:hypothetical protein